MSAYHVVTSKDPLLPGALQPGGPKLRGLISFFGSLQEMQSPIVESWIRIETWLKDHAPDTYAGLNGPATEEAIRAAEVVLPGPMPGDFRAFFARHDGQSGVMPAVAGNWNLLPLYAILRIWKGQKELLDDGTYKDLLDDGTYAVTEATPVGPVRPVWWSERWIPFTDNGFGDHQCIDLDPPEGGQVGQIVIYWHDREKREFVAGSLSGWLARVADDLETGQYATGDG